MLILRILDTYSDNCSGTDKTIEKENAMQKQICLLLSLLLICTFFSGTASAEAVTREISKDISASAIDISSVPDYSGTDYIVLNGNLPDFYVWQIT